MPNPITRATAPASRPGVGTGIDGAQAALACGNCGQPLRALLTDDDLVITAGLAAPRFDAGSGGR